MTDRSTADVESPDKLEAMLGPPDPIAIRKQIARIDRHARDFIALSPFLCIGTASADGAADVSPRGDPPGFVQVLDDRTLLIPDRPGNNRTDSMRNILENPNVGLLFFIPGFEDTLRVNGKATIVSDRDLLSASVVNGKAPKVAIRIAVEEVFLHCAKALKRSKLWDPAAQVERKALPSLVRMIMEQVAEAEKPPADAEVAGAEQDLEDHYKTGLY
ncbi:pyridoxamine 5'-phosphate oxidase family protein [Hyphomicrobium sp.]|uniref:pyridoxamine 5'-phosphate oxidase family protein n=1 Tax=Hyphomicrobium sp. TaxID=82 RepID=UPI003D1362C7